MKNFALIWLDEFVAKKHDKCIKDIKGNCLTSVIFEDHIDDINGYI